MFRAEHTIGARGKVSLLQFRIYISWGRHPTCRKSLAGVLRMRRGKTGLWEPERDSARHL